MKGKNNFIKKTYTALKKSNNPLKLKRNKYFTDKKQVVKKSIEKPIKKSNLIVFLIGIIIFIPK